MEIAIVAKHVIRPPRREAPADLAASCWVDQLTVQYRITIPSNMATPQGFPASAFSAVATICVSAFPMAAFSSAAAIFWICSPRRRPSRL